MQRLADWIRTKTTDYTSEVGRVFLRCGAGPKSGCNRVVPHYRLYGKGKPGHCRCGHVYVRPAQIPEWQAAVWLLWGYVTKQGDPRMPMRQAPNRYA